MQQLLRMATLLAITLSSGYMTKKVCPDYCQCTILQGLRNAACIGQRLPNIETGVPNDVQNLTLSNNSISTLKNYGFKELQLTSIIVLNISHNHIGNIGFRAFAKMLQLQILDLSNNHLYYIHQLTFEDTPKLQALYLSANRIKITADPFLVSESLQILDISRCHLGSIWSESLSMLPSLSSLNLRSNQLIGLDVKALKPLKKLKKLYLTGNPFSCNGKALELQAWLDEHNIDEKICKTNMKNEDMFQKIILKDSSYNKTTDRIFNGWFGAESEDKTLKCTQPSGSSYYIQPLKGGIDKIPSFWAMLIGFEIGFAAALFGTWMWLSICGKQKKRLQRVSRRRGSWYHRVSVLSVQDQREDNERLWNEQEHVNCPGTPPPAYRNTLQLESFQLSVVS